MMIFYKRSVPPNNRMWTAGAASGIANSVVCGPVEHIRTRLQIQTSNSVGGYKGPIDAIRRISSQHGIAGLYKGQGITVWREAIGFGFYFMVYESIIAEYMRRDGTERKDISTWKLCLAGAMAGYSLWISVFPLVRTRIFVYCLKVINSQANPHPPPKGRDQIQDPN